MAVGGKMVCETRALRRTVCVDERAGKGTEENVVNLVCQGGKGNNHRLKQSG